MYSPLDTIKIDAEWLQKWASRTQNRQKVYQQILQNGLPALPETHTGRLLVDYDSLGALFPANDSPLDWSQNRVDAGVISLLAPPESLAEQFSEMRSIVFEIWGADWPCHNQPLAAADYYKFAHCPGIRDLTEDTVKNFQNSANITGFDTSTFRFENCPIREIDIDLRCMLGANDMQIKIEGSPHIRGRSIDKIVFRVANGKPSSEEDPCGVALVLGQRNFNTRMYDIHRGKTDVALYVKEIGWDEKLQRNAETLIRHGIQVKLPAATPAPPSVKARAGTLEW